MAGWLPSFCVNFKFFFDMKKLIFLCLSTLSMIVLSACSGNQSRRPVDTTEKQEETSPTVQNVMYGIDIQKSQVKFVGRKPTGQHRGVFALSGGDVYFSGTDLTAATFTVDINSLAIEDIPVDDPDNAKLMGHLLSSDFFDAENSASATFTLTGTAVYTPEETGDEASSSQAGEQAQESPAYTHTISGNLMLRGVSKNITFPATVSVDEDNFSLVADFTIDRTAWGMVYGDQNKVENKVANKLINNEVSLNIVLFATRATSAENTEETEDSDDTSV